MVKRKMKDYGRKEKAQEAKEESKGYGEKSKSADSAKGENKMHDGENEM